MRPRDTSLTYRAIPIALVCRLLFVICHLSDTVDRNENANANANANVNESEKEKANESANENENENKMRRGYDGATVELESFSRK